MDAYENTYPYRNGWRVGEHFDTRGLDSGTRCEMIFNLVSERDGS